MNKNVKTVFISSEGGNPRGSICEICKLRRVYFADELRCPGCGSKEPITESDKKQGEYLVNEYETNPIAVSPHKEDEDKSDLPEGAKWV